MNRHLRTGLVCMFLVTVLVLGIALPTEMLSSPVVEVESCCCHGLHAPSVLGAASSSSCACHVCPSSPHLFTALLIHDFKPYPPLAAHRWNNLDEAAPGFCPEPAIPPPRVAA